MAHAQDVRKQLKPGRAATKRFYRQQDAVVREQRAELAEKKTLELEAKKAAMRAARVRDKAPRGIGSGAAVRRVAAKKSLQRGLAATKREERERQRAAAAMESGLRPRQARRSGIGG